MSKGVLMASGGIDSTVLMYDLHKKGLLDSVFFVDYGQASAEHQASLIEYHTEALGLEWYRFHFSWPDWERKPIMFEEGAKPAPLDDAYELNRIEDDDAFATALEDQFGFLQGRNVIWLVFACSYALHRGCSKVYNAFQLDDEDWESVGPHGSNCSDQSPAFVRRFNQLAAVGPFTRPVRTISPFLLHHQTKEEIVRLGRSLGVPFEKTYSCEFYPACTSCRQCLVRDRVFG